MTPEEKAALIQAAQARVDATLKSTGGGGGGGLTPDVPIQRQPNVEEQARNLNDAARERYSLSTPGPEADLAAKRTVDLVAAQPKPVTTTWSDQLARSLLPQVVTEDQRPASAMEIAENAAWKVPHLVRQALIPTPEASTAVGNLLGLDPSRNPLTPYAEQGTPTENAVLYLMRVIGTAAPALVQETVERAPSPDIQGAENAAARGAAMAEIAAKFFTPSTVGKQFLGTDPNELVRVDRPTAAGDWAQGVLERIENGTGFERDLQLGFRNKLGQDWENTGWWLGLGIDTLTDWEGAIAKGPALVRRISTSAKELGALVPTGLKGRAVWDAVKGNELGGGKWIGNQLATDLEAGRIGDVPDSLRPFAEEVAQNEYGMSWRELRDEDGLGPPRTPDPANLADRTAVQQIPRGNAEVQALRAKVDQLRQAGPSLALTDAMDLLDRAEQYAPIRPFATIHNVHDYRRLVEQHPNARPPRQGEGFKRMESAAKQAVSDPVYVVRDAQGSPLAEGTLAQALAHATKKRRAGVEVWYGTQRPVARWGTKGFASDFHFASDAERATVDLLREKDAALTVAARSVPEARLTPSETVGHVLGDFLTSAPGSSISHAPASRSADVVRKATALKVRSILGTERLKALPNTAIVAVEDHARILAETTSMLPTTARAEAAIKGTGKLTEQEIAQWRRFVPGLDPAAPTIKDWNDARHAAMREVGGFLADTRYRLQGNRPLMDRFILAFKDAHIPARNGGKELKTRGIHGWLAANIIERFTADATARMPEAVRNSLKEMLVRVQSDANQLLREIRRRGGNVEEVIRDSLSAYHLPHPTELDRAAEIRGAGKGPVPEATAALEALRKEWRGSDRPSWLDSTEPLVATAGMRRWASDIEARARHIASDWILVHIALNNHDASAGTDLYEQVQKLDPALLRRVYDEVVRRGSGAGPALAEALATWRLAPADQTSALIQWVLTTRSQGIVGQSLDRLVREGIGVRGSDPRLPVLRALLTGQHRTFNAAASRWDHLYTEQELTWASGILRNWAIAPGAGAADELGKLPVGDVLMPKFLIDEAERLVRVGGIKSSTELTPSHLANQLFILWKQLATHGYIIPNPAHYVGQMVGLIPTLVTTRGFGGAMSALGTLMFSNPALVGELVKRVGGRSWPTFRGRALEGDILRTAAGEMYGIDELEDIARAFALGESRPDFEVGQQIAELMQRPGHTGPMWWQQIKQGAAWWQDHVQGMAGAFDLHGRMAVFVDEIKRGTPPESAAMKAREAMLDFRELTPFEGHWMRLLFTFYAYMRKNSDAYVKAMLLHPQRVTSQMRLAHAELTHSGLTNIELGAMTDSDISRLNVHSDREVINDSGRVHPMYKLNRVTSSPIGVGEALATLRMLVPIPGYGLDVRGFLQSINPAGQAVAIALMGQRLDRSIDRPWNNRIPPYLLDMPFVGDFLGDAVGAGWEPLTKFDDPLLADDDATHAAGVPAYWAAGVRYSSSSPGAQEAQRRLWQEIQVFLGRPISTVESMVQAAGGEALPPNVTQSEQLFDALLGFKHRGVLKQGEAVRRFELQRESRLHDAANTVRPPEGVGPR